MEECCLRPFSTLPQLGNAIVIATTTQDVTISPGDQVNTFTTNCLHYIFSDSWETVLNLPEERSIIKGHLLTTLPILGMEWRVSHEFRPTDYSNSGWTNSIHLTTGGDNHQYGYSMMGSSASRTSPIRPRRSLIFWLRLNVAILFQKRAITGRRQTGLKGIYLLARHIIQSIEIQKLSKKLKRI